MGASTFRVGPGGLRGGLLSTASIFVGTDSKHREVILRLEKERKEITEVPSSFDVIEFSLLEILHSLSDNFRF